MFRFDLRTLLIAVAVLALVCPFCVWAGYWAGYSARWIEQRHELRRNQPPCPAGLVFDCGTPDPLPRPLKIFGEEVAANLLWSPSSPYTYGQARQLFPESAIYKVP